jgi:folate-binding Fe-S cluster repair protein YgfZ
MTLAQAQSVSHQGKCDQDVIELMKVPAIARQLAKINPETLAKELREYGAWDAEQLANHQDNLQRLVWIAGCDIKEEHAQKGRK